MENFVIIKKEKVVEEIPRIYFEKFDDLVDRSIMNGEIICVWGPSGCGKSIMVKEILKSYTYVDFHSDILKSRKDTENLLNSVKGTESVLLFDDVDIECGAWKCVTEFINNSNNLTGPVVFVSRRVDKLENQIDGLTFIPVPAPTVEQVEQLANKIMPDAMEDEWKQFWNGNIRNFVNSLTCYKRSGLVASHQDEIYSTQDSIKDLICKGGRGYKRFIGQGIEEHGHMQDLIFTNYKCQDISDSARVAEYMSNADVWDDHIYAGNWDFLPYFTISACVLPARVVGNVLDYKSLRAGSAWTKHYNYRMRKKQVENFMTRNNSSNFDIDFFSYLAIFIKNLSHEEIMKLILSYDIRSQDIDLMNHIILGSRLKGRNITHIKKALKHEYARR